MDSETHAGISAAETLKRMRAGTLRELDSALREAFSHAYPVEYDRVKIAWMRANTPASQKPDPERLARLAKARGLINGSVGHFALSLRLTWHRRLKRTK